MLVLSREQGQSIVLYDDQGLFVEIKLTDINSQAARLGITAPANIHVDRFEIYTKKERDKKRKDR